MRKKIATFLLIITFFTNYSSAFASSEVVVKLGEENFIVSNLINDSNGFNFEISNNTVSIKYDIEKINSENLKIETITELADGSIENHFGIYNAKLSTFELDGKVINIEKEIFTNKFSQNMSLRTNWVYYASQNLNFSEVIVGIGAIATIVGGVIAGAALLGVSIATSTIASSVANWASVIGLGSLASGYLLDGTVSFDTYRTTTPIQVGGIGAPVIAYRYQNVRLEFSLADKTYNQTLVSVGSPWSPSKPF